MKRKCNTGIRSEEQPSEAEEIDYRYSAIGKYFFAFRGKRREGRETLTEARRHGGRLAKSLTAKSFFWGIGALPRGLCQWEGPSSSHGPFFSREAALSYSKVGMPGPWRPKFQLRSSVPAGDAMAALPRKWVSGGAPTLPFDARAQGVA